MLLQPEDFSIRVAQSFDHDIGDGFTAKYTNSSSKKPAHLQLTILAFCLTSSRLVRILAKDDATPTKSACRFVHTLQTIVFEQRLPKFWSMQHKWYDFNHQLHIQINTLVFIAIITNHPWKLGFFLHSIKFLLTVHNQHLNSFTKLHLKQFYELHLHAYRKQFPRLIRSKVRPKKKHTPVAVRASLVPRLSQLRQRGEPGNEARFVGAG